MNKFDMMEEAMREARATQRAADKQTATMAKMVVGRLKKAWIPNWVLRELKQELKDYNMHTGRWMR